MPIAVVSLAAGAEATEEEIQEWCKQNIGAYKCPRAVRIVKPEEMPYGMTLKVRKLELRDRFSDIFMGEGLGNGLTPSICRQQNLYFLPEPQGQGALRGVLSTLIGLGGLGPGGLASFAAPSSTTRKRGRLLLRLGHVDVIHVAEHLFLEVEDHLVEEFVSFVLVLD